MEVEGRAARQRQDVTWDDCEMNDAEEVVEGFPRQPGRQVTSWSDAGDVVLLRPALHAQIARDNRADVVAVPLKAVGALNQQRLAADEHAAECRRRTHALPLPGGLHSCLHQS